MSFSSKVPSNQAVWLNESGKLEVKPAPYTRPSTHEVVIQNRALAINPADWIKQAMGGFMFSWQKYPCIMGFDVSGDVVEVGDGVTRFKVGDRVVSHAMGISKLMNDPSKSGFQLYVVLLDHMTSHIPTTLSYEQASVIPLGLSTAACGLFQKDQLALPYPSLSPKPAGKTLLIWGGSTSIGCNAIQLAVAAGYEVFTTSSPRNFRFMKQLGASQAFDYNSKTVIPDLIRALEGKAFAGAMSIGHGSADACMDIINKCRGNKFLSMVTYPVPDPPPESCVIPKTVATFLPWIMKHKVKCKLRGIKSDFVEASTLIDNGLGEAVYVNFLEEALKRGSFVAAPDVLVAGKGLESVEVGMKLQREGVSAKKVVISLDS